MSFPPRPPMGGVHQFMQQMAMGIPPPTSQPPPFFSGPPPARPPINLNQPPPVSRQNNQRSNNSVIYGKPVMSDHPLPIPQPSGPAVTVFVGNITDKWPDAMIRQLLATCGQVLNWKRVQGASGKLQGFGFCDYNGPDAGLRAVRILHDLEVGDKKLVVKVDAKTSSVLDEFKADRKKTKDETDEASTEDNTENKEDKDKRSEDYMDKEMLEMDEKSKLRIESLFREFKSELEQYVAAGNERASGGKGAKAEKDPAAKQGLQDKLHLLKLSSLDPTPNDNPPEDIAVEEGKREIISQEIGRFREYMKQEKEKEDERKRMGRDRRDRDRDDPPGRRTELSPGLSGSPARRRSRERSPRRDFRRRSRDRDFDRVPRDRDRDNRDWGNRRRSRDRRSTSNNRDRSPAALSKSKYREREEEEEARDLKAQERKAREKEQAYEDKLRIWERKEGKKMKELKITRERQKRVEEDCERDGRRMKQFLEDYDDEKHDPKYYKGRELQKRLAERAKELEADNKDRQREREELEEMRLRVLTGGGNPAELFEKYKKPTLEVPPVSLHLAAAIKLAKKPTLSTGAAANNRLPSHLSQNSAVSQALHQLQQPTPLQQSQTSPSLNKASTFPYKSPTAINNRSNSTTPNSFASPAQAHAPELSASVKSLANTGFLQGLNNSNNSNSNNNVTKDENESRQSYSDGNSPADASPVNSGRDDDSSFQEMSPEFPKKKKIEVHEVFNQDEDDNDGLGSARKRKLVPLDYGEEGKKPRKDEKSQEDKKKHIKSLIDRIPTDKEALFEFVIDWDMVDNTLMERRIRPWINKKIIEYIGEPEPTLVDFICSKVLNHSAPQSILDDVMQVLDEEAEVFIVKMWRLLVYEIEAKKYGIASKT